MSTSESELKFGKDPELPKGVEISPGTKDLWDSFEVGIQSPDGTPEYQEARRARFKLRDTILKQAGLNEPEVRVSPTSKKTTYTRRNAEGQLVVVERTHDIAREGVWVEQEVAGAEAIETSRSWIDKRQQVRELKREQRDLNLLGGQVGGESQLAADEIYKAAREKGAEAQRLLDELRAEVPPTEWESYELGKYEELPESVSKGLELVHQGLVTELVAVVKAMPREELHLLRRRTRPEDQHWLDKVADIVSEEA